MELYKRLTVLYIVALLLHNAISSLDVPKHFCGSRLSDLLDKKCKLHNGPSSRLRTRRSIVEECCRRPCSQKYLLCNYCADSDEICNTDTNHIPRNRVNEDQIRTHPNEIVQEISKNSSPQFSYSLMNNNAYPCHRHFQHRRIRSLRNYKKQED